MEVYEYTNGHWEWNDKQHELEFISHAEKETSKSKQKSSKARTEKFSGCTHTDLAIEFRHDISLLDKIRFQRHYQRHVKPMKPAVVTIRDIKDVVLYNVLTPLPAEFINLFHTVGIDKFLRALIIYFQLFIETYNELMERRKMQSTKLRHPNSRKVEQKLKNDLNALRIMLAKEYTSILLGSEDLHKYHHMANKQHISAGERDIRLWELLYGISVYVVWVAHCRQNLPLIELEINNLFRTDAFNLVLHDEHRSSGITYTPNESWILGGDIGKDEHLLLKHTPLHNELATQEPDYRMLGLGILNFKSKDPRVTFFEKLYCCSEEKLQALGVKAGILGLPRNHFDAVLVTKKEDEDEDTSTDKKSRLVSFSQPIQVPRASEQEQRAPCVEFAFPDMGEGEELPITLPPCLDLKNEEKDIDRKLACNMWIRHGSQHAF